LDTGSIGIDLRDTAVLMLRGEWDAQSLLPLLKEQAESILGTGAHLGAVMIPVMIWCAAAALMDEKAGRITGRICACTAAASLTAMFVRVGSMARNTALSTAALCESAAPVLATLLTAAGGVGSAALLTPSASMAAQCCADIICGITLPLAMSAGVIAAAPAFSERFGFAGVRKLITGLCNWIHGALLTLFVTLLGLRGLLKGGADSLSMKTARYTVDSLLPVVGGEVADSLGILIASAKAVQGCIGAVCCIGLLIHCVSPVLAAGGCLAAIRICSALTEPFGVGGAQMLLEGYADVFKAVLVAIASAAMLFFLLAGASVSMARALF